MADGKKIKVKKRVAIVGGGVAGLAAAWHLHTNCLDSEEYEYEVHVYEKEATLGGHACTVSIPDGDSDKNIDVDIGFMVFNNENYPNMVQWFDALGVETESSDMSLAVSLDQGKSVEWSSDGINGLFAKRSQMLSPTFYRYIQDMVKFNAHAAELLRLDPSDPRRQVTTGHYLKQHGYLNNKNSSEFATYYLLPMMAALWSASMEEVMEFPAEQLIGFLCNHKMLQLFDRPEVSPSPMFKPLFSLGIKGSRLNMFSILLIPYFAVANSEEQIQNVHYQDERPAW
jgi:predicted NAD/FAD-binding protein